MAAAAVLVIAASCIWVVLGVHAASTDVRSGIIPRRAVWAAGAVIAALLGGAALALGDLWRFVWALGAMLSVAAFFEVIYRVRPRHVGYGDVRLIIVNSLLAGWWGIAWSWWALMAGAVAAWPSALMGLRRHGRAARVRWGPSLAVGTAAVIGYCMWTFGPAG
ncbi:hypothetical protein [Candidatus Poriferisodalis sp.]|uniref:hypothetical protein n=1 Tax=Candidatus Poriferisodalis sp. TaxID=3101277 RepID=UPI003B027FB1